MSVEYLGDGVISVFRVVIFPLTLLGVIYTCNAKRKTVKISNVLWVLYFLWFSLCMVHTHDNVLFPLMIIFMAIFMNNAIIDNRGLLEIDYARILVLYGVPHIVVLLLGVANFDEGRFAGLHEDPNFCGVFLSISAISAVLLLLHRKDSFFKKLIYALILIADLLLIVFSGSRGAILTTITMFALLFMMSEVKTWFKITAIIAVILIIHYGLIYIDSLPDWVSPEDSIIDSVLCRFKPESMSDGSGRAELWETAVERIHEHSAYILPVGHVEATRGTHNGFTHNTWLDFLVENGVLVGGVFVVLLLASMFKCYRLILRKKVTQYEKEMIFVSYCVLIQFLSLSAITQKIVWIFIFFLFAISNSSKPHRVKVVENNINVKDSALI